MQDPKRTLTNGKDTHMHVVARQNMEQAFQHMAAGGSWEAVELSPNGKEVMEVHTVKAGPKLVEMIKVHYPQLHPTATSVATVKSQVSSIAVQDLDVLAHLVLEPARVALRDVHECTSAHHAAPVVLLTPWPAADVHPKPVQLAPPNDLQGAVAAPSSEALTSSLLYFSLREEVFPPDYYREGNLRAYRRCSIFTPAAESDPRRKFVGQFGGWPKRGSRGGSVVKVRLSENRCVEAPLKPP